MVKLYTFNVKKYVRKWEIMMKKNNELKELRFNLTHEMQNNFIEILVIEQMIREKKYKNDFELKLMIELLLLNLAMQVFIKLILFKIKLILFRIELIY